MAYKVESEFDHMGLKCVVIMTGMGHRCGYVGVAKGHPLYGKNYSDKCLHFDDVSGEPIGKRGVLPLMFSGVENGLVSPDLYFDVHGGITYAEGGIGSEYPIESSLWWFGFDTAHAGDGKNLALANEYGLLEKERYDSLMRMEKEFPTHDMLPVRSLKYCEAECRSLAEQLSKVKEG